MVVVGLPASGTDEGIETVYVPDPVIGDAVPVTDNVVLPTSPTLVTVPLPPDGAAQVLSPLRKVVVEGDPVADKFTVPIDDAGTDNV